MHLKVFVSLEDILTAEVPISHYVFLKIMESMYLLKNPTFFNLNDLWTAAEGDGKN